MENFPSKYCYVCYDKIKDNMNINELEELLDEFLNRWTITDVKKLTLHDYVDVGNRDTFCQWVETKTRILGSIKGMTSIKFGIYKRRNPNKRPAKYQNDDNYSWMKKYGSNREIAFENIKNDIIKIIELSGLGKFSLIDDIILPDLFKWKVAFLYSNERLIPIYNRKTLSRIAEHFGLQTTNSTKIYKIQEVMISNKPSHQSVYQFMRILYDQFGNESETQSGNINKKSKQLNQTRRGTKKRNTKLQIRTIMRSYVAEQKHNKIQETLKNKLISEYGEENVILEEDYVDIKLKQPNYIGFYEVKSSSYASECVREALGQILLYTYNDQDIRNKKIYVVGQYPANEQESGYIDFIKENLKLDFQYINIAIE